MKKFKVPKYLLTFFLAFLMAAPPWVLAQSAEEPKAFKQEELDQILAPIALYPDDLLSQVLMASTYPLEVVQAERWQKQNKSLKGDALAQALEKQDWDPSVKSLVNFPDVLTMMSEKLDWTQKLGDAFLEQEKGVMDTVQKLRQKADEAGNLKTTSEQKVIVEKETKTIVIEPANPQTVYVPTYNPTVVYGAWWYPAYPPTTTIRQVMWQGRLRSLLQPVSLWVLHGVMHGVDVTGMEAMWISTLTGTRISTTTLIAASTRTSPEPGRAERERVERESGNITRNTVRALRTAIKGRHRSLTKPRRGKPLKLVILFGAVQNKAAGTFPKVERVNSAASRVASRAREIEPRGARPVAKAFNMEGATVLLEEAKAVAKRDNRAAAGVRAVRARVQGVEVEVVAVVEVEAEAAAVAGRRRWWRRRPQIEQLS